MKNIGKSGTYYADIICRWKQSVMKTIFFYHQFSRFIFVIHRYNAIINVIMKIITKMYLCWLTKILKWEPIKVKIDAMQSFKGINSVFFQAVLLLKIFIRIIFQGEIIRMFRKKYKREARHKFIGHPYRSVAGILHSLKV